MRFTNLISIEKNVEKVVTQVGDLPAMPAIVSEVLSMTQDPNVPMSELSELIQRDPALTAKILRVSNSPYYGMRQYVGTLKLALVILGAREVRNIVVGIAVFDTFRDGKTAVLLADDFWNHSLSVAALSKKLGSTISPGMQCEGFIPGLLHDIGKMVLCRYLGDRYVEVYRAAGNDFESLFELENQKLGFNHADAGAALAIRWNLPKALCDALYYHHAAKDRPISRAEDPCLAAVVRIANLAARHDFDNAGEEACRACADIEAWDALESSNTSIPPDERCQTLAGFMDDLKDLPKLPF